MKTKSKALLLTLCAVLLVAASVLGTMAYLTSTDTVTNTFTVGKVEIKLDETDVTNPTGSRVQANSYKLMPGTTYTKDPTVTVKAGSEESYVRMKVTFNNATKIIAAQDINRKATLVLAVSLSLGLGVELMPDILGAAPQVIRGIFSSGITTGGLTAILANLFIRVKEDQTE